MPENSGLSRSQIVRLIIDTRVLLQGIPIKDPCHKVHAGEIYDIMLMPPKPRHLLSEKIDLDIIYEDDVVLVVNKPAGLVVHPGAGNFSGTLVNGLIGYLGDNFLSANAPGWPGIVHRIDKDTSGLLVVAKTIVAHQLLSAQFKAHNVRRFYRALCHTVPRRSDPHLMGLRGVSAHDDGGFNILTMLARHPHNRQRQSVFFDKGKSASTHILVEKNYGYAARIKCRLETGRTHQIRAHMQYIGHPLIGDPLYARAKKIALKTPRTQSHTIIENFSRQALHAEMLGFYHPINGEMMNFTISPPQDFQSLEKAIAQNAPEKCL